MNKAFESELKLPDALRVDWKQVKRVLVVRLRSIGDTVLATPSLIALRRFLPDAQIDILLEDWVAPLLDGFDEIDNVLIVKRDNKLDRLRVMASIARRGYDVAYNLHGGTTAGFFTAATLATHRVGFKSYQNKFLYNYLAPPAAEFWGQKENHSAEQQLALLGWTGVPVADRPKSRLVIKPEEIDFTIRIFREYEIEENRRFALIHPAAAFESKQWGTENFAGVVKYLFERDIISVAVGTKEELPILFDLFNNSPLALFLYDKTLPQITALASKAHVFVGNDSGIAHVAAAVNTPSVVIFGSSNIAHWRPWTDAPNEIVSSRPPGVELGHLQFDKRSYIQSISVENVTSAIERVLS